MSERMIQLSATTGGKGGSVWQVMGAFNTLRSYLLNHALGPANFEIRTNFDIQNGDALNYVQSGIVKTLATDQAFDTGTAAVIAASQWGVALLSISAAGAGVVTWETASGAGYATEALAIAAMPAVPAGNVPLGYATVQAHASGFTAGTDALQGGTGGNVSPDTNYYNSIDPGGIVLETLTTQAGTPA